MSIFSSDVSIKNLKKKDFMCLRIQARIRRLCPDVRLKGFKCCISLKCTAS